MYLRNVGLKFSHLADAVDDRPALKMSDGSVVTYGALNRRANRVAAVLESRGLARRDVIAIVHNKTVGCYAVMLAALKLGAAYVNVDEQNPPIRLRHIFDTARPKFVFAESSVPSIRETSLEAGAAFIDGSLDEFVAAVEAASELEPASTPMVTGADPAYIMYTSGSTGIPKGAIITHANVLNFGAWVGSRFGIGFDDVLTNVNPMYFDNSVFDFYGALLNGAAIAPVGRETLADGAATIACIEKAECTVWFSVPSLLIYLMTVKLLTPDRLGSIRTFVFGGEGYPKPELQKLFNTFSPRSTLVNVYGPTECTCICSAWNVRAEDFAEPGGLVTLGPIAENFSAIVVDGDRTAHPGEMGELWLMGPQVGLGYVNDKARTAAAFAPNPFNERWSEATYRTGDLVRLGEDGRKLYFVGRADNQIKHMGYRIELEEIEAALSKIADVNQCAVVQKTGRRGLKMIVAYVSSSAELSEGAIRAQLEGMLPPYMIPQIVSIRHTLPKNANGKIDRRALADEGIPD